MERVLTRSSVLEAQKRHGIRFPQYAPAREDVVRERFRRIAVLFHPGFGREANPYILDGLATESISREQLRSLMEGAGDMNAWIGFQGLRDLYELSTLDVVPFIECFWKSWPERADHSGFYVGNAGLTIIAKSASGHELRYIPKQ